MNKIQQPLQFERDFSNQYTERSIPDVAYVDSFFVWNARYDYRYAYTCEKAGNSASFYAWWNWWASNIWAIILADWFIETVVLTDEWTNAGWATFEVYINWLVVLTFSQTGQITRQSVNIAVKKWDTLTFACTSSWNWWTRVATIGLLSINIVDWLKWERWESWINAIEQIWRPTLPLPPANNYSPNTSLVLQSTWDSYNNWPSADSRTFVANLTWPSGSSIDYVKLWFSNSNQINSQSPFQLNTFSNLAIISNNIWIFNLLNDWVEVSLAWTYEVYASLFVESSVQRINVWFNFSVNWVEVPNMTSASNYIRSFTGHNSSSTSWSSILQLSPWDKVWIQTLAYAASWVWVLIWDKSSFYIKKID